MSDRPLLEVTGLRVELLSGAPIVEEINLSLGAGRIVGIVGESGSGKTTTSLALLGFARPGVRIAGGSIRVAGEELVGRTEAELRRLRGRLVSYVPQDPAAALNPSIRIGDQIREVLRAHSDGGDPAEVSGALERVELPATRDFVRRYPHQLSGGQQQRVAIAAALVGRPPLVVMDEPTTGLDVVTQASVLDEIQRLRRELGVAIVYVTHNLAVVSSIADDIAVMYAGRIVECGPAATVLGAPRHPYTRGLVASIPDFLAPRELRGIPGIAVGIGGRPPGCAFAPRCDQRRDACEASSPPLAEITPDHQVRCLEWQRTPPLALTPYEGATMVATASPLLAVESLRAVHPSRSGDVVAAHDVSFTIARGEAVALVGESGSGKTTIGRCIGGLHTPAAGRILLESVALAHRAGQRPRHVRQQIQIVFQNPYDTLNPRTKIIDEIARPARILRGIGRRESLAVAAMLLEQVRLPQRLAYRFPAELSGGERQRVAIARALAAEPSLLICDEITSALDVSVQATVLELLAQLRSELGLALLFISHDLGVVAHVASRALVLESGVVREQGTLGDVLERPQDDYTKRLIAAAPRL